MRRYLAVAIDCYLCLLAAGLLVRPYADSAGAGRAIALAVLFVLALSFANQVLLTALVRASAGKLIMGLRVIGLPGAGRPGLWRLVRRWLYGPRLLPSQVWHWLRSLFARSSGEPGAHRGAAATASRTRTGRGSVRCGAGICWPTGPRSRNGRCDTASARSQTEAAAPGNPGAAASVCVAQATQGVRGGDGGCGQAADSACHSAQLMFQPLRPLSGPRSCPGSSSR
ncbi:RDD family protein [Streptomyces sp. M10(2022)]